MNNNNNNKFAVREGSTGECSALVERREALCQADPSERARAGDVEGER